MGIINKIKALFDSYWEKGRKKTEERVVSPHNTESSPTFIQGSVKERASESHKPVVWSSKDFEFLNLTPAEKEYNDKISTPPLPQHHLFRNKQQSRDEEALNKFRTKSYYNASKSKKVFNVKESSYGAIKLKKSRYLGLVAEVRVHADSRIEGVTPTLEHPGFTQFTSQILIEFLQPYDPLHWSTKRFVFPPFVGDRYRDFSRDDPQWRYGALLALREGIFNELSLGSSAFKVKDDLVRYYRSLSSMVVFAVGCFHESRCASLHLDRSRPIREDFFEAMNIFAEHLETTYYPGEGLHQLDPGLLEVYGISLTQDNRVIVQLRS